MMTIKIIVTLLTILIGSLLTKKELKALFSCLRETEYVELSELNKAISKKPIPV